MDYFPGIFFRIKPFWLGIRALQGLVAVAAAGLINLGLKHYANVDVIPLVRERIGY